MVITVLVIPVILSGCLPAVGPSDGGVEINGKNTFAKGAVVANFPPVPIYPEAVVIESYSSNGNFGASFVTKEGIDKVISFYQEAFVSLGWENNLTRQTANNYLFEIRNATKKGSVIINTASDSKSTAITVALSPR